MLWVDLLLRWLHILSAIALGGGILFWRFALASETHSAPDGLNADYLKGVRSRWAKVVMGTSGLLLVTGLVNFFLFMQRYELDKTDFPGSKYHMLFGIKFLLSLGLFTLAALLTGRTAAAENLRRKQPLWLNVSVLLVIAVVVLGGLLRAAPRRPKSTQSLRSDWQQERVVTDASSSLTVTRASE